MISLEDAFAYVRTACHVIEETESLPLSSCLGRVLHKDARAVFSNPAYDVSAMDGYAVCASEYATNNRMKLQGVSAAGADNRTRLLPNHAMRIFTGAGLPDRADAIIIQENAACDDDWVIFGDHPCVAGQFVRKAALDFAKGESLQGKGSILTIRALILLASAGLESLQVRRKPVVGILASGKELVALGQKKHAHRIVSSNSLAIAMIAESLGGNAIDLGIADDQLDSITSKFEAGKDCNIIVTSGGASVGGFDLMPQALTKLGYHCLFSKIAMRPGKPVALYKRAQQLVLVLPGNPVSTFIGCALFLRLCLYEMLQVKSYADLPTCSLPLACDMVENSERMDFQRAQFTETGAIMPANKQDSSMQKILSEADGFILRSPFAPTATVGSQVDVILCKTFHSSF